jgi:MoaA/NifB/PqqE/SkfB family radical SAM enzyme
MTNLVEAFTSYLPPRLRSLPWRAHPLDGKLLLFERNTGLNVLLQGDETQYLRRVAPRTLLIAVTNACNLTCPFCYRDLDSRSQWRFDTLLEFCQQADQWGVLEVAFGGGEPMLFPRWPEFIAELYRTTRLGINFTTNGLLLTETFLRKVAGQYGQIRVSLYEDNSWQETVSLLARHRARFGVNWLITPIELKTMAKKFVQLLALGVRDFLLLSYKGALPELHLTSVECQQLAVFVNQMLAQWGHVIQIKLDICWGDALPNVPRLFEAEDCEAGDDFLSITSDRCVKPCSFHYVGLPFETVEDVKSYWQRQRQARYAAPLKGCARLPKRGFTEEGTPHDALIYLATIQ